MGSRKRTMSASPSMKASSSKGKLTPPSPSYGAKGMLAPPSPSYGARGMNDSKKKKKEIREDEDDEIIDGTEKKEEEDEDDITFLPASPSQMIFNGSKQIITGSKQIFTESKQMMEHAAHEAKENLEAVFTASKQMLSSAAQEAKEIMVYYEDRIVPLKKFKAEVVPAVKSFVLFHSSHIPEYLNAPFVKTGYRANYALKPTLQSIFWWHNESFNIWSHLVGALLFFVLMFYALNTWLKNGTYSEKVIFSVFAICAQIQMLASTCFHWFGCMGKTTFSLVAKMDYTGIAVMIVGSYFPLLYYFFYCDEFWMVFYMSLVACLGVATLLVSWLPWFEQPQYAPLRALTFISLGSTCMVMIPHFLSLDPTPYGCLLRMGFMGLTYVCGAAVYTTNIPERWFPGEFDNFMASHNIWHIFVLGGAVMVYVCCYFVREWRMNHPCDCEVALT